MKFDRKRHDEFAQLFVLHQARVYRYIVSLVPNRADADELFQETNLTLWKKWDQYDRGQEFFPWACGIAVNHVRNFWRKRRDVPMVFDEDLLHKLTRMRLQDDDVLQQRQLALTTCLEELRPRQRETVQRYYSEPGTVKAIAESDGRSPAAVYKMLERIRSVLHECIDRKLVREA